MYTIKKYIRLRAIVSTLVTCSYANATAVFDLSLTDGPNTVTAKFQGIASGNDITSISNVSVWIDGIAFNGNGALSPFSYNLLTNTWETAGVVVSFNGANNNVIFLDDPTFPTTNNFSNWFFSIPSSAPPAAAGANGAFNRNTNQQVGRTPILLTDLNYRVTQEGQVLVPEPETVALITIGLLFLGLSRRKINQA